MRRVVGAVVLTGLRVADWAGAEWTVEPRAGGGGWAVASECRSLAHGRRTTTARTRVDPKTVAVPSPSVLGPGFIGPATGTRSAAFSLVGFTRACVQLGECR